MRAFSMKRAKRCRGSPPVQKCQQRLKRCAVTCPRRSATAPSLRRWPDYFTPVSWGRCRGRSVGRSDIVESPKKGIRRKSAAVVSRIFIESSSDRRCITQTGFARVLRSGSRHPGKRCLCFRREFYCKGSHLYDGGKFCGSQEFKGHASL